MMGGPQMMGGPPMGGGPAGMMGPQVSNQADSEIMQAGFRNCGPGCRGCNSCGPGGIPAGGGVLPTGGMMPVAQSTMQVTFGRPEGMQVRYDQSGGGMFDSEPMIVPARQNFPQGALYRVKLTNIPGREGVELYPTIELAYGNPRTGAYLAHNSVPVQFEDEDFDQVATGNFVTKVIYLPDPDFSGPALAGIDTLVSTRLDPSVDPIVEADRRGSILAIIRLGDKDIEMTGCRWCRCWRGRRIRSTDRWLARSVRSGDDRRLWRTRWQLCSHASSIAWHDLRRQRTSIRHADVGNTDWTAWTATHSLGTSGWFDQARRSVTIRRCIFRVRSTR